MMSAMVLSIFRKIYFCFFADPNELCWACFGPKVQNSKIQPKFTSDYEKNFGEKPKNKA
jgi:hypothetical protein